MNTNNKKGKKKKGKKKKAPAIDQSRLAISSEIEKRLLPED